MREQNPHLWIVGVEPAESPLLSRGQASPHGIQGIGSNFLPPVLDRALLDEVLPVTETQAIHTARQLAREEGILAGISSGAALCAALTLTQRPEHAEKTTVVILPDTGRNYLSEGLFRL